MAFHPNSQSRLIEQGVDPVATIRSIIRKDTPWDSVIDFATHPSFCGSRLYPRQHTLLKLMFLEIESMTDYDLDVIEDWRRGFTRHRDVYGVQPDIWERIKYLKSRGARRFPHIQFIGGRRGSKGLMGGILGAEQIAYFHSLDDWQQYYGVDAGKDGYLNIGATSQTQAKDQLFADIRSTVERCQYLHPYIAETKDHILSVRTPADIRRIGEMKAAGVPIDHLVATLKVQALSSQSAAGRGATAFGIMLDEFAFMLQTGSAKSGEAQPLSTPVLTPHGWRPMGELGVGDFVIGRDGQPTKIVKTKTPPTDQVFRVTFHDGTSTRCSPGHLWEIRNDHQRKNDLVGRVVSTEEMSLLVDQGITIPTLSAPVVFDTDDGDLPVPPYLLGYLLGDGCLRVDNSPRIALPPGHSDERNHIEKDLAAAFPQMKLVHHSAYDWGIVVDDHGFTDGCQVPGCDSPRWARNYCSSHYRREHTRRGGFGDQPKMWGNPLGAALSELGLMGLLAQDKYIPRRYFTASPEARLALLQGLMDSDGSISREKLDRIYCTTSPRLRDGVIELVEGLGGQARWRVGPQTGKGALDYYRVNIRLPKGINPFRMERKAELHRGRDGRRSHPVIRRVVSVEPDGNEEMQCIEVAAEDGLYVTEHCIVTHNSIYEDWAPSLDQFDLDGLMYVPSSPYCLEPKTRVLTEDLRWVPVGSLNVGDRLIGFDEHPPKGRGQYRSWQPAVVTETSLIQAPRYEMTTESGKKIVCTGEHMWLAKRYGGMGNGNGRGLRAPGYPQKFCWIKTHDLMPGDSIKTLGVDPWEPDESRGGGYLAGLYDGEGCFTKNGTVGFAQNPGAVQEKFEKLMAERGFMLSVDEKSPNRSTLNSNLLGGLPEIFRFMGSIRPERLLPKFTSWLQGRRIYTPATQGVDTVVSVRRVEDGPVIALGTSTQTLVAEGLLSHNTRAGRCYSLYQQGSVLMETYTDREGGGEAAAAELKKMAAERGTDLDEVHADPTMLIVHLPSWGAYEDWERGPDLVGIRFKRPIQPGPEHESQRRRKLRNPEKFQVERCLDPDTRVLCADYTWRRIDDLKVGDELVGFDEYAHTTGAQRKMHTSVVKAKFDSFQTAYRITFDDGTTVTCSADHRWLSTKESRPGKPMASRWRSMTPSGTGPRTVLGVGDSVRFIADPWERDESWEAGYLAGFMDGEGTMQRGGGRGGWQLSWVQNPGEVADKVLEVMKEKHFVSVLRKEVPHNAGEWDERTQRKVRRTRSWAINGMAECMRFVGSIGGEKIRRQAGRMWEGKAIPRPHIYGRNWKQIVSIDELPPQRLVDIETTTSTFIAEGFASHNSAQWAEVMGAYFDADMVDRMFLPPTWRAPLQAQGRGYLDRRYRIHCDPGRTGANFALCIGHTEEMCPTCNWTPQVLGKGLSGIERHPRTCPGTTRPHVIIDLLHVWRPADFPPDPETGKPTIDYVQVREDIEGLLRAFPSTTKISFDQWNSAGMISELRRSFSPEIRVAEVTFTEKENQRRCEQVKSAINLGWVSSYADTFGPDGSCLLEQEMKYLSVRAGKVVKQDIGPITTKDLFDAYAVVVTDLLHAELDRQGTQHMATGVFGSSNPVTLRSGRTVSEEVGTRAAQNRARLAAWRETGRPKYEPSRLSSIRSRRP